MQSKLSRRGVVAGIAIAPVLPAPLMQKEADAELVALGKQFTDMVELLNEESLLNEKSAWSDKVRLSGLADIGIAIMDTPATTMQGLIVKARIACFAHGSGFWLRIDPDTQPGFPFAMSIVEDLVRRYDPDLEWTNDLVPSPERARHAHAMRQGYERRVAADIEAHFRSPCLEWLTVKQLSKRYERSPDLVEKVADSCTRGAHPLAVMRQGPYGREYRSASFKSIELAAPL
jgi:hypothetical protein